MIPPMNDRIPVVDEQLRLRLVGGNDGHPVYKINHIIFLDNDIHGDPVVRRDVGRDFKQKIDILELSRKTRLLNHVPNIQFPAPV